MITILVTLCLKTAFVSAYSGDTTSPNSAASFVTNHFQWQPVWTHLPLSAICLLTFLRMIPEVLPLHLASFPNAPRETHLLM